MFPWKFIFLCFCFYVTSNGKDITSEIDVNVEGDVELTDTDAVISATLHNNFDFPIAVYFEKEGGSLTHLLDIKGSSSEVVTTFHGHSFHATKQGASSKSILSTISITLGIVDYFFLGPNSSVSSQSDAPHTVGTEVRDRLHPSVKLIGGRPTKAMNARFRSLSSRTLDLYYEDGRGGSPQGTLGPGQDSTTNAYEGHVFFYTPHKQKNTVLGRVKMSKNQVLYLLEDGSHPVSKDVLDHTEREVKFMREYYARTGIHWRGFYGKDGPRPPPVLYMWPADRVGQVHHVNSTQGFWSCSGAPSHCQSSEPVQLEIEVISRKPRAFVIPNFLSAHEAEAVIALAKPRIRESTVGNADGGGVRTSSTRTSSNTWIGRKSSPITEALYLRAADLLNVHESLLTPHTNAEEMQVVHYQIGQKYDAHHDWGVNGYAESRFITLLLYLNDMKHEQAGGETSFPKAAGGRGIKVHPGKGSAVLFYNLLEDGNGDDLALHEATALRDGEKWLSNFWVWDPKRK